MSRRIFFTLSDAEQAALTPSINQQALERDRQCIFSGVVPSGDSDALVATWVFPPFLGFKVSMQRFDPSVYSHIFCYLFIPNKLSDDPWLETTYYADPDACNLSELMVAENVVSGRKDIVALFWENKLGIDVEMRITPFKYLAVVSMTYRTIIASSYSRDWNA